MRPDRGSATAAARPWRTCPPRARTNGRSSPPSSATSSASRPPPTAPTPRTSTACLPRTSRWPGTRSRPTAGWSRSSSATRSWGCSGSRSPTRTIPNAPSGRRSASARRRPSSRDSSAAPRSGSGSGSTPARPSSASASPRPRASGSSPGDASTPPRGSRRSRPRWAWRSGLRPTRRRRRSSTTRSSTPRSLKGKAEPVRVFQRDGAPRAASASTSTRTHRRPFVGREIELALLEGMFDKRVAATRSQLVTIVGEPGLGKSRLVRRAPRATSMTGRELVTLAPGPLPAVRRGDHVLGARRDRQGPRAGSSSPTARRWPRAKLDAVAPRMATERAWLRERLLPLLGHRAASSAGHGGAVHRLAPVPRAPGRGAPDRAGVRGPPLGRRGAARLPRAPGRSGRGRPIASRRHRPPRAVRAPPDFGAAGNAPDQPRPRCRRRRNRPARRRPARERRSRRSSPGADPRPSRGNPLYAEEFVRLLRDRDLWSGRPTGRSPCAPAPRSRSPTRSSALLAARLDTLSPERKAMLADAAVIGKVFWAGPSPRWASGTVTDG